MNPYFLLLYVATAIYQWLDISNFVHLIMSVVKNIKLVGSMLLPDPKGTIEHLRGGILKVNYVDPHQSKGNKEPSYVLLPYSVPALSWTKVFAISNEQYEKGPISSTKKEQAAIKEKLSPLDNDQAVEFVKKSYELISEELNDPSSTYRTLKALDGDVLDDIDAAAHETRHKKSTKVSLKHYEKTDVTEFIEMVAGPGKDFFGCRITPAQINQDYRYLIFHFHKRTSTFAANDDLSSLSRK